MGTREEIIAMAKAEPELSGSQVARRLGVSRTWVARILADARREGRVPPKPAGRPPYVPRRWEPAHMAPEQLPEPEPADEAPPPLISTPQDRDAAADDSAEMALAHAEAVARLRQLRDGYVLRAQKCEVALASLGAAS